MSLQPIKRINWLALSVSTAVTSMVIALVALVVAVNSEVNPYHPISRFVITMEPTETNLMDTTLDYCAAPFEHALLTSLWLGPRGEAVLGPSTSLKPFERTECKVVEFDIPRPQALKSGEWRWAITLVVQADADSQIVTTTSNPIVIP